MSVDTVTTGYAFDDACVMGGFGIVEAVQLKLIVCVSTVWVCGEPFGYTVQACSCPFATVE